MTDPNARPDDAFDAADGLSDEPAGVDPSAEAESEEAEAEQAQAGEQSDDAEGDADTVSDEELAGLVGDQDEREALAAERLADLQRVTAEYANYRRRTEANREVEKQRAVGDVLLSLLPVLDDVDRADKHGDLGDDSPFKTIADKLRQSVAKLGAEAFGAPGDAFDHNEHDALFQQPSDDVEQPTILEVIETGYRLEDTLLRAAKVVVAVPKEG